MREAGFDKLVQTLAPGGRLLRVRRLRGGLGAQMHVLSIRRADGSEMRVALRRYIPGYDNATPEAVGVEFEVLQLALKAGIAAPRALLADAEGALFGVPALVLEYVPGSSRFRGANTAAWTAEFARAALQIHAVTPDNSDLSALPRFSKEQVQEVIETLPEPPAEEDEELASEVRSALLTNIERVEWLDLSLIHGDFWPGNTVWYRGHLRAVIDWSEARLGDRRSDVAQCEIELSFTADLETGDSFVSAYEQGYGLLPQLWFFQLYRGLIALSYVRRWLVGYRDVGVALDSEEVMTKLRAYIRRALSASEQKEGSRPVSSPAGRT